MSNGSSDVLRPLLTIMAAVLLTATACTADDPARADPDRICDATECVSVAAFGRALHEQLNGKFVGHLVLVGTDVYAGGQARTAGDPPAQGMSPAVVVNTASVGKTFTAIAVLKSLARHHLTVDSPIGPYLPPDWIRGPNVDTITFRELLTHRSGFRHPNDRVFQTEAAAQEQIAQGVSNAAHGSFQYNNINFTIFRDLLPYLEGQPDPGPALRIQAADRFFLDTMQREVFTPAGVHDAVCGPAAEGLLSYPELSDTTAHGFLIPGGPSACSSGGWSITPAGMLRIARGLLAGGLLPEDLRRQMDEGCLGWDCPGPAGTAVLGKFGGIDTLQTFMGTVMGRMPVVIVTNSLDYELSLDTVLAVAFLRARVP
jgi:CubicO group peptidase (beta-lactamase class C family)